MIAPNGPKVRIAQPPRVGRLSGGFRFNHDLASSRDDIHLVEIDADRVLAYAKQHEPGTRLWLDSLYLYEPYVRRIDWEAAARSGALEECGLIVHGLSPAVRAWVGYFGAVLCPSAWLRDRVRALLRSRAPGRRRTVVLLYPGWDGGIPDVTVPPSTTSAPAHEILTVANWVDPKGFVEMAWALRDLHRRRPDLGWRWTVAGELEDGLVARVRRLLGPAAPFLHADGVLEGTHLTGAYLRSSVFFLLSHAETYSLATQEAGLYGLPMVISGVGGMPEAAARGQTLARHLWGPGRPAGVEIVGTDPYAAARALERYLDALPSNPRTLPSPNLHPVLRDSSWAGRATRLVRMRSDRAHTPRAPDQTTAAILLTPSVLPSSSSAPGGDAEALPAG